MQLSPRVRRFAGDASEAWKVHAEANKRKARGEDILILSIGDPDFDTPSPIVDKAVESLRRGRTHYTPAIGIETLRVAAAEHYGRLAGRPIPPEAIAITPGAQCALYAAAMTVLKPGDKVIVTDPIYVTYGDTIRASGADLVRVPLRPENEFRLDSAELRAAVTPQTAALLLNYPNNPTGASLSAEEVEAICAIALEHDLWVLSDEVYAGLTYDGKAVLLGAQEKIAERCLAFQSLSKTHAMSGWRLGWIVMPEITRKPIEQMLGCMLFGMPPFLQDAAAFALQSELTEVAEMREIYRRRRDVLCDGLAGVPSLQVYRPSAGMFVMLDCRATGLGDGELAMKLLDATGISTVPCSAFGPSSAGHLRLSLCVPEEELAKAAARIAAFLTGLAA